jgi:hypothetical protein
MRCGEPLKSFIAYIPNLGEACMRCNVEYAINEDRFYKPADKTEEDLSD